MNKEVLECERENGEVKAFVSVSKKAPINMRSGVELLSLSTRKDLKSNPLPFY